MEFVEKSRVSNGGKGGAPNLGAVGFKGHVILPTSVPISVARRQTMEREARKKLTAANIPL